MDKTIKDLMNKGELCLNEGRYEEALEHFDNMLRLNPDDPDILNKKGTALRSLGRYGEAVECFNRSLEILPRDSNAS